MAADPTTVALDLNTDERFVPLRKRLGVRGFGINQLTLQASGCESIATRVKRRSTS